MSTQRHNNSINPAAGGRRPPNLRVGLSPAAGYAERYAHKVAGTDMFRMSLVGMLLLSACGLIRADHCPEDLVAVGASETHLAQIGFESGGFSKVLHRYGQPDSSEHNTDTSYPEGSGEAKYTWTLSSARLEVFTMFYSDPQNRVESVVAVRLEGNSRGRGLKTGRGLRLGDDFDRVRELYGPVFLNRSINGPKLTADTRTICFADETELGVGLDERGVVKAIWLRPSGE